MEWHFVEHGNWKIITVVFARVFMVTICLKVFLKSVQFEEKDLYTVEVLHMYLIHVSGYSTSSSLVCWLKYFGLRDYFYCECMTKCDIMRSHLDLKFTITAVHWFMKH